MKHLIAIFSVFGLVACGEETTPLTARFAFGPAQVRGAVAARNPAALGEEPARWPVDEAPLSLDVVVSGRALVAAGEGREAFGEQLPKTWPAVVSSSVANNPFEAVEVLVGPATAMAVDDPAVTVVAHGAVPARKDDLEELVFADGGARRLAEAVGGGEFALFVRGRAPVALEPGDALPADEAGEIVVEIPLRTSP